MATSKDPVAERFDSPRPGANAWALREENVQALRQGSITDVKPVVLEFAPTLDCNQSCSECPYRQQRGPISASPDVMHTVLEKAKSAGVQGVIWTGGGEPTLWPLLAEGLAFAASHDMVSGLYSNGIRFGEISDLSDQLLAPQNRLEFVRLSLNAATEAVAYRFAKASPAMLEHQWKGLHRLVSTRDAIQAKGARATSIQVSVIVDSNNVQDLEPICRRAAEAFAKRGFRHPGDAVVIRPLTKHKRTKYGLHDHDDDVIGQILSVAGRAGAGRDLLEKSGAGLYLGFGLDRVDRREANSYAEVLLDEYGSRDQCWANGLFLTVGPNGSAYLCTDRNCDPAWEIGSLLDHSVEELLVGEKRSKLLERVHLHRCGQEVCEATCRMPRLHRIARALRDGTLTDADVEKLRTAAKNDSLLLLS